MTLQPRMFSVNLPSPSATPYARLDGGTGVNYYFGGDGGGPGTGQGNNTFVLTDTGATQSIEVVQDWTEGNDQVNIVGSGFTSFDDLLSHSYQNGAYFVVQPDANNAIWINGGDRLDRDRKGFLDRELKPALKL